MGNTDKIKNTSEEMAGRAKEKVGDVLDDEALEEEGREERSTAQLRNAGENVKDAARSVKDAVTE